MIYRIDAEPDAESGCFVLTSPDVPGFVSTARTENEAMSRTPDTIEALVGCTIDPGDFVYRFPDCTVIPGIRSMIGRRPHRW